MNETITTKADRYLTEGRVRVLLVNDSGGEFEVAGSDKYSVKAMPWTCNCPARVLECAHIVACQKITSFDDIRKTMFVDDDANSRFLADLLGS